MAELQGEESLIHVNIYLINKKCFYTRDTRGGKVVSVWSFIKGMNRFVEGLMSVQKM